MTFDEWKRTVPASITGDPLWSMRVYQQALYLSDLAWADASRLLTDKRTVSVSDQLYRAVGSISANIAEGYSRSSGKDRARIYEYALGSAREARDWYFKGRHLLGDPIAAQRMDLLTEIIRLTLRMLPKERALLLSDGFTTYDVDSIEADSSQLGI